MKMMRMKPIGVLIAVAVVVLLGLLIHGTMHHFLTPPRAAFEERGNRMNTERLKNARSARQTSPPASTQYFDAGPPHPSESIDTVHGQSWTGVAESDKAGPYLRGAGVYVELPERRWPQTADGKRIVVTGRSVVRHDLPVFIVSDEPLPPGMGYVGGILVPKGTDLHKASERTVIEDAQWHLAAEQKSE